MENDFNSKKDKIEWIPFISFLVIIFFGLIILFFTVSEDLRSPVEPSTGCLVMQDNGDFFNSINIVFLGTKYEDVGKFREDSEKMMLSFLNTVPYSDYKNRFNFFRIEEFKDFGCKYDQGAVICNPALAQKEAIKCPGGDYIAVLVDRNKGENLVSHLRSSSWMNLNSLNSADDPLVFAHEFAHSFVDFADEYEFDGKINWDAPNCDSEYDTCPKFSNIEGSECHVGCVNKQYSRSIDVGIMRDYWIPEGKRYGIYNEWFLKNEILEKTIEPSEDSIIKGMPQDKPQSVYVVKGTCDKNGNCNIDNVSMSPGYPSKGFEGDLELKHGDFFVNFPKTTRLYTESKGEDNVIIMPTEFVLALPMDKEVESIEIIENGKIISEYKLNLFKGGTGFGKIINIPKVS